MVRLSILFSCQRLRRLTAEVVDDVVRDEVLVDGGFQVAGRVRDGGVVVADEACRLPCGAPRRQVEVREVVDVDDVRLVALDRRRGCQRRRGARAAAGPRIVGGAGRPDARGAAARGGRRVLERPLHRLLPVRRRVVDGPVYSVRRPEPRVSLCVRRVER